MDAKESRTQALSEEILKELLRQGHELITTYIRAFTVYIVITGGLVKFALDQNATPQLRLALSWLGILVCILGLVSGYFGYRIILTLRNDIDSLTAELGISSLHTSVMALRYLVIIAVGVVVVTLVGWLVIVLTT